MISKAAHKNIGQNIQPLYQIELLEDHRAVPPPLPQIAPTQCSDIGSTKGNLTIGRVDKSVYQGAERDLPAPDRPITPTNSPGRYPMLRHQPRG